MSPGRAAFGRGVRSGTTFAALLVTLIGALVSVAPVAARQTRAAEADAARDAKAASAAREERSRLERVLFAVEDSLLLDRWLAAPRGVFLRLGGIGEGAGFGVGPAARYNGPAFDVRASAAASFKQYLVADVAVRFPGTPGANEYIRPDGPYVEVAARFRDLPQEDFFGLGPESAFAARSDYALRETSTSVTAGLARRNVTVGLTSGYLANDVRAGTDTEMPSSTATFAPADVPGLIGRPRFVVTGAFARLQTRDRAVNDQDGGEYLASFTRNDDQSAGRFSFDRWDVDLRQFVTFRRRTRTLALRAWAASASPHDGHDVPFYQQPWLGGARTVRGLRTFRYRDRSALLLQGEYRWRINEFTSGALFYDAGAVARTLGDLGRLERSWGAGLRLGGRAGSAVRLDMAFGSGEGRRLLLRFDDVF